MKALQIIHTAYRATLEEQDDTVVWLTHAMRGAGAELGVLLRGSAVNYAMPGQNARGLKIGDWLQTQPPRIAEDVAGLIGKDVPVYAVAEDLTERGLETAELVAGVERVGRGELPRLFERFDQVWGW